MEFSLIFKNLRLREKLTQKELAEELQIPQSTISKYEKGQLEANYKTLIKIANYFKISVDYLLGRE
ncbi:MAG: helix-turn-helix domain-containing protein [Firmicutes bacterium]|nr:helix-turn-helix domain-containing protein [Bacillota bacterium]